MSSLSTSLSILFWFPILQDFFIVEQEFISLGQTGARWVDGWMREHGHCYGYMIYLYLIVLIYIYVIIIYIIVYSFFVPNPAGFFLLLSKSSSVWVRPVLGEAVDSPAGSQDL